MQHIFTYISPFGSLFSAQKSDTMETSLHVFNPYTLENTVVDHKNSSSACVYSISVKIWLKATFYYIYIYIQLKESKDNNEFLWVYHSIITFFHSLCFWSSFWCKMSQQHIPVYCQVSFYCVPDHILYSHCTRTCKTVLSVWLSQPLLLWIVVNTSFQGLMLSFLLGRFQGMETAESQGKFMLNF